jgi:hypothetical protein
MVEIIRKSKVGNSAKSVKDREDLQEALDKLSNWADRWGMDFNVNKCKIMHVGHNNEKHIYTMKGQQLTETEEERDIGVMVSRHLKPCTVQKCGKDSTDSTGTADESVPLQG